MIFPPLNVLILKQTRKKTYEINTRSCIVHEIGKGLKGLRSVFKTWISLLHCNPMHLTIFTTSFTAAALKLQMNRCKLLVRKIKLKRMETKLRMLSLVLMEVGRKGYASLNGVVAAMSHGKVVESEVMSKVCLSCRYWHQPGEAKHIWIWRLERRTSLSNKS